MAKWSGVALAVILAAGCRDDLADDGVPPDSVGPTPAAALELLLEVPDTLGWNQTDSVRVTVHNRTAAAFGPALVGVMVPASVVADSAGADSVVRAGNGTRVELALPAVAAGASVTRAHALRMPPAPRPGESAPTAYPVRAALRGTALARQDTIHIRPGSQVVSGGCGGPEVPSAQRFGVGPVRVGITAAALRGSCPEARDSTWQAEGMPEWGLVVRPGGVAVLATMVNDTVGRVDVRDERIRTAAGVGVGTPLADLRARYGRTCGGVGEGVVAVWFQNAPGISFQLDTAVVRDWLRTGAELAELPDSARVIRFMIHGHDPGCPPS